MPTIVGAIAGAVIAHFSARARGHEEHEPTLDLLVLQDERRTARDALEAVRDMRVRLNTDSATAYRALHNEWSDRVLAAARLIRDDDLDRRARAGAYVIFLATLTPDEYAKLHPAASSARR